MTATLLPSAWLELAAASLLALPCDASEELRAAIGGGNVGDVGVSEFRVGEFGLGEAEIEPDEAAERCDDVDSWR